MKQLCVGLKSVLGRLREVYRRRPGHAPSAVDVRYPENGALIPIYVRPNFYYFSALGRGRPAWLPLYPSPRMQEGLGLNRFRDKVDAVHWPSEPDPYEERGHEGDWVQAVGQHRAIKAQRNNGGLLNNERVVGGCLSGNFESSSVWLLVVIPKEHIAEERLAQTPVYFSKRFNGYLAWGNNLWLGNQNLDLPRVAAGAAQNPPSGFE